MADKNSLVINAAGAETRVALVENGTIHEYYLERKREKGIVGNIYKGRVVRVLPGMQAAFVDIGLEKAAFLYVGDVTGDPDFSEEFELTEGEHSPGVSDVPSEEEAAEQEARAQAAVDAPPVADGAPAAEATAPEASTALDAAAPTTDAAHPEAPPVEPAAPEVMPTEVAEAAPVPDPTPTPAPVEPAAPAPVEPPPVAPMAPALA